MLKSFSTLLNIEWFSQHFSKQFNHQMNFGTFLVEKFSAVWNILMLLKMFQERHKKSASQVMQWIMNKNKKKCCTEKCVNFSFWKGQNSLQTLHPQLSTPSKNSKIISGLLISKTISKWTLGFRFMSFVAFFGADNLLVDAER